MSQETKLKDLLWQKHSLAIDRKPLRTFMFEFKKDEHLGLSGLFKYCTNNLQDFYDFIVQRTDIPLFENQIESQNKYGRENNKFRKTNR